MILAKRPRSDNQTRETLGRPPARRVLNSTPVGVRMTCVTCSVAGGTLCRDPSSMKSKQRSGESANAIPHTQKWRRGVTHIWGNPRGQPTRSAMGRPHPRASALVITDSSRPGKYKEVGRRCVCLMKCGAVVSRPLVDLLLPVGLWK